MCYSAVRQTVQVKTSGHTVTQSDVMALNMLNHYVRKNLVPLGLVLVATWILQMIPVAQGVVEQTAPNNKTVVPQPLPPAKSAKR